jgi:hypothetical protein
MRIGPSFERAPGLPSSDNSGFDEQSKVEAARPVDANTAYHPEEERADDMYAATEQAEPEWTGTPVDLDAGLNPNVALRIEQVREELKFADSVNDNTVLEKKPEPSPEPKTDLEYQLEMMRIARRNNGMQ